jgi:hypothetical protein
MLASVTRACDAELKHFRATIEPELHKVIQLLPPNYQAVQESREETALCLSAIATDYTWADDFVSSERLHEEALKLAQDTLGAIRIEHGLAQIREAARKQRVFGALKPIASEPSLRTINGFGFTLYGQSDYDEESRSYVMTYYFVALFVPIFPVARYRVINTGASGYRFLGKLPLRKVDRWHLGIAVTAIAAMIVIGAFSSNQTSDSSYTPQSSPSYDSTGSPPTSQSSQLSELKARIDSERARMAPLETQLKPVIDELTSLDAQMETLNAELKSLDEEQKAGVQIVIDDYNVKVKRHNALLVKIRALVAANKSDLKTYNDLDEQGGTFIGGPACCDEGVAHR